MILKYVKAMITKVIKHFGYVFADEGPLLLTWFNFNSSMDSNFIPGKSVGWNYLSIPKLPRLHRWSLLMDN